MRTKSKLFTREVRDHRGLTLMQLYRKLRKGRRMLFPSLEAEIKHRCKGGSVAILMLDIKPRRKPRGINWDSGDKWPKRYKFNEHRETLLLLCAAKDGQL